MAILIERAKQDDQIAGVVPHLVNGGLSILQYVDEIIVFMEHDLDKARNLKPLLPAFEQMLGLKINFHKTDCSALEKSLRRRSIMPSYLVAHMGIEIHYRRLTIADWKHVEERIEKQLSS